MSDEQIAGQATTAPVTTQETKTPSDAYGQPISEERQAELQGYLDRWQAEADHGERQGPFDHGPYMKGVWLTGADVSWLAEQSGYNNFGQVPILHLEGALLNQAHLEGAFLGEAHLERASLYKAHLERARFHQAHLEGASLTLAHFDEDTELAGAYLGPGRVGDWLDRLLFRNRNAALGDIKWHGADLTAIPWERLRRLGEEHGLGYQGLAVRAYRQVATQLRAQGMAEVADRFAYRAQLRQRGVLLYSFQLPQYLFSWVLALLAGYGYRPGRTLFWYLVTIAGFAFMYMQATHGWIPFGLPQPSKLAPLPWYEALILSVSSFHGRGFFQPLQSLGDPVAALAAIEAVIGLFIDTRYIALPSPAARGILDTAIGR
jgi:hypothetical protein